MSLGTLSNVNVDVTDIKMATGSWYFLSFQCSNSTNSYSDSYSGSQNKGIQIHCVGQKLSIYKRDIELPVAIHDVQDVSAFLASAHDYRLRAVPFIQVESRFGRTGESEIAKRRTGETERGPAPVSPRLTFCFFFFVRIARFSRSRDHPEGLLAV